MSSLSIFGRKYVKGKLAEKEEANLRRVQKLEGRNLEGAGLSELMQIKADLMSSLCQVDVQIQKLNLKEKENLAIT